MLGDLGDHWVMVYSRLLSRIYAFHFLPPVLLVPPTIAEKWSHSGHGGHFGQKWSLVRLCLSRVFPSIPRSVESVQKVFFRAPRFHNATKLFRVDSVFPLLTRRLRCIKLLGVAPRSWTGHMTVFCANKRRGTARFTRPIHSRLALAQVFIQRGFHPGRSSGHKWGSAYSTATRSISGWSY